MKLDLTDNETTEAPVDNGGGGAEDEAGAEVAPEGDAAPEAEASTPASPPAFDPDSPEAEQWFEQRLQAVLEANKPAEPETPLEFDPFGDNPSDQIKELLRRELDQALSQYKPAIEAVQVQQTEQWVEQTLSSFTDLGEFDKEAAAHAAAAFVDPRGTPDWAKALRSGAEWIVNRDKDVSAKAVEAYKASLNGNDSTPYEPGSSGAGVEVQGKANSYDEIVARYEGVKPVG